MIARLKWIILLVLAACVKVLIRLHNGAKIKVKIGEVGSEIDSAIGVCKVRVKALSSSSSLCRRQWRRRSGRMLCQSQSLWRVRTERQLMRKSIVCAMPILLNSGLLFSQTTVFFSSSRVMNSFGVQSHLCSSSEIRALHACWPRWRSIQNWGNVLSAAANGV